MEFKGELETHITICAGEPHRIKELWALSERCGLKFLHIVLDRGQTISQPMLSRRAAGRLSGEMECALKLAQILADKNFTVARIKIEAAPANENVPQTHSELSGHSPDRYFENHVKILCDFKVDYAALTKIAENHSAHLSRNALRCSDAGLEERFITQRCFSVGYAEAHQQLKKLLREISDAGYQVIEVEEEYVVYDSNLKLDDGWI